MSMSSKGYTLFFQGLFPAEGVGQGREEMNAGYLLHTINSNDKRLKGRVASELGLIKRYL